MRMRIPEVSRIARGHTLHVGCAGDPNVGDGGALHRGLRASVSGVVGIDLAIPALRALRGGAGDLVAGDALALPFADASFDTVVAAEIIEHVGWPERLLSEARRVLRPGGILVLTTPNPFCIEWLPMARRGHRAPWDPSHVAWFDPATLASLARRVGLTSQCVAWVQNERPGGKVPPRLAAYLAVRPVLARVLPAYLVGECFIQVFVPALPGGVAAGEGSAA